jgi:hypothetical protein
MQILVEIDKTLRMVFASHFGDTIMYPHLKIFAYRAF